MLEASTFYLLNQEEDTMPGKTQQTTPISSSHHARERRRREADRTAFDVVDVWGFDSFPASDAPANW
jgi:hypothetical protein